MEDPVVAVHDATKATILIAIFPLNPKAPGDPKDRWEGLPINHLPRMVQAASNPAWENPAAVRRIEPRDALKPFTNPLVPTITCDLRRGERKRQRM